MKLLTKMASRFVAGETQDEALLVADNLKSEGLYSTLDILGENVNDKAGAEALTDQYCELLWEINDRGFNDKGACNVSLKLTMLGLDISPKLCEANLIRIVKEAHDLGDIFVRVDMEGSAYTDRTLDIFCKVREKYSNVGIVLQAYLHRTYDDLKRVLKLEGKVRLCKGAYKERPEIAWQSMKEIRKNYLKCADLLLDDDNYHAFASHDVKLLSDVVKKAKKKKKQLGEYELQMLFGMNKKQWYRLSEKGYPFRVYVPFGTDWLPYFTRRLLERKENVLFVLTHLFK